MGNQTPPSVDGYYWALCGKCPEPVLIRVINGTPYYVTVANLESIITKWFSGPLPGPDMDEGEAVADGPSRLDNEIREINRRVYQIGQWGTEDRQRIEKLESRLESMAEVIGETPDGKSKFPWTVDRHNTLINSMQSQIHGLADTISQTPKGATDTIWGLLGDLSERIDVLETRGTGREQAPRSFTEGELLAFGDRIAGKVMDGDRIGAFTPYSQFRESYADFARQVVRFIIRGGDADGR